MSGLSDKALNILAEQIGVSLDDINQDDSFLDDLHMTPADLTEFAEKLRQEGIEVSIEELGEMDTVSDLLETLKSEEELN
jgi:acyl carrier protein